MSRDEPKTDDRLSKYSWFANRDMQKGMTVLVYAPIQWHAGMNDLPSWYISNQ